MVFSGQDWSPIGTLVFPAQLVRLVPADHLQDLVLGARRKRGPEALEGLQAALAPWCCFALQLLGNRRQAQGTAELTRNHDFLAQVFAAVRAAGQDLLQCDDSGVRCFGIKIRFFHGI